MSTRRILAVFTGTIALVLTPSLASPAPDASQPPAAAPANKGPVIAVSAIGEVQRKPDYAVISIGVGIRDAAAGEATSKAEKIMEQVTKAVNELKLPGQQLQTGRIDLSAAYSNANDWRERKLIGYDAEIMLSVRTDDTRGISKVIDAAVAAGANRIQGISFELKQAMEARQEAIKLAAKAAKEKAKTLAEALGLRITGIISATSRNVSSAPMYSNSNIAQFSQRGGDDGEGDNGIQPGMITVKAEASVEFAAE